MAPKIQRKVCKTLAESFWRRVSIGSDNACWLWNGTVLASGYGQHNFRGKKRGSHRCAFELANGPIPDGLVICHSCDTPLCVNPKHLFLGTQGDNVRDCQSKGRLPVGEQHKRSKATRSVVLEIRSLYSSRSASQRALAVRFGLSQSQINSIIKRNTWAHV